MNDNNNRNNTIDLLRVCAMLAVVRLHAGGTGLFSDIIHYLCSFAVPIFFLISGYFVLSKKMIDWSYVGRRCIKYITLLVCWSILLSIAQSIWKHEFVNPVLILLRSMKQHGLLWQGWYIWSLIIVTLLTPFLHRLMQDPHQRRLTSIVLLLVVLAVHVLDLVVAFTKGFPIQKRVPQSLRVWTYIFYYWVGGLESTQHFISNKRKTNAIVWILLTVIVVIYQIIVCQKVFNLHTQEYCYIAPLFIPWAVLLFELFLSFDIKSKRVTVLISKVSELTLGIYIVHPLINTILKEAGYWSDTRWVLQFCISLVGSVVVVFIIKKIPYLNKLLC